MPKPGSRSPSQGRQRDLKYPLTADNLEVSLPGKPANKPVIAVDIDDVLMPHFQDLINWYNKKYKTKLTLANNHPTDPRPWGTESIHEAVQRVHGFFDTGKFLSSQPYRESVKAVNKLSQRYSLMVVTARDTILERVTRDWLKKHFGELFADAHFTARYSLDGKSQTKTAVCLAIGAGYLVDDALDLSIDAAKAGIKVLLFGDYPWNQTKKLPRGIARVKNWQEVLEYFNAASR